MYINVQRKQGECYIDIKFQSPPTGITALFGPSGAGKSSVVNMIAGLLKPDSGVISINDKFLFNSAHNINLPPEKRHLGYVFQEALLFPHLSVKSNLLYGKCRNCIENKNITFDQVINLLDIKALLSRKPKNLSGGEKQRVSFGRAVLSSPHIMLLDEPLASLDTARKKEILPFIKQLNEHFNIPMLYVSHSLEEIEVLSNNVINLVNGKIHDTPKSS